MLVGFITSKPLQIYLTIGGFDIPVGPRGFVNGFRYAYLDTFPIPMLSIIYNYIIVKWKNTDGNMILEDAPKTIFITLGAFNIRKQFYTFPICFFMLSNQNFNRHILYQGVCLRGNLNFFINLSIPIIMLPSLHYNILAIIRFQKLWRQYKNKHITKII